MKNALLSASASGAFWLLFLFFACFLGIHTVRLAKIGWKYRKDTSSPPPESPAQRDCRPAPPPPKPSAEPSEPEPVYYIVERKRKRPRETYSPPREIRFK